ncbi:high mobility group B protein 14-like [Humulus lupulus]|uniref:high mobility group B protein 14-like n=1 Tax=Humulus lupulus TaxID=3486 RepID=UPI002B406358|nr:high mobility group B protein 14-like [Humulus lupulus]
MAKGAKTSQKSSSPSTSDSAQVTETPSTQRKMVLRVKTTEGTKRSARLSAINQEGTLARSVQKSKAKHKKISSKIDAKKPKKPPTAFFFFLEDFRKVYQEQNPDVKSMRDIGKACGVKWKTMTYEEKVQYYDIATEKRAAFDSAMAEYTKRKESGEESEDEETEDDSEFGNELKI